MPIPTRRHDCRANEMHKLSRTKLDSLPAEILQEIAYHLDNNPEEPETSLSGFSDVDHERMSVTSLDPPYGKPNVTSMACCRPGDPEMYENESRMYVLSDYRTLAATSRRIREVLLSCRQTRRETIRYCDHWKKKTMQLSDVTRSRYT
jgi:hypothetical protein